MCVPSSLTLVGGRLAEFPFAQGAASDGRLRLDLVVAAPLQ